MPESDQIRRMFGGIACRYDLANHVLCGGMDLYWRWRVARSVAAEKPIDVADLACGSGDLTFALQKQLPEDCNLHGLDFCEPMLEEARTKLSALYGGADLSFEMGDCMDLPLDNSSIDAMTIAFGLRNFEDRRKGFEEMQRVLRPGGVVYILEFTQPYRWFRPVYYFYLKCILPTLAGFVTGNEEAYEYLAGSIESFPECEALSRQILDSGFESVSYRRMTFGVVAIHRAVAG